MTRRWITTGSRRRLIKLVRGILKASVDRVSVSLRTCVSASARQSRGSLSENLLKKERKKTHNPREGWENGTPPPHRDFKERRV